MPRIGAGATEQPVSGSRLINTSEGLQGGGSLAQDLELSVRFGTAADTAVRGNDAKLTDARPWTLYGGGSPVTGQALVWDDTTSRYVPGVVTGQTLDVEEVRDIMGATLVAGNNVSILVDDVNNTITVSSTGTGSGTVNDATTTSKGIIQLAGDLAGTSAAPTVPGAEKTVRKSTNTNKVPDGYIGADSTGNIFRGHLPQATSTLQGTIQLAGELSGTATNPTVPELLNKVDKGDRAPVGGHVAITYNASVTPNAALANSFHISATGNLTLNPPTGGVDGQRVIIEVWAQVAARTLSFASSFKIYSGLTTPFTIPVNEVAIVALFYSARTTTWYVTGLNAPAA